MVLGTPMSSEWTLALRKIANSFIVATVRDDDVCVERHPLSAVILNR